MDLDDIDRAILAMLTEDARVSMTQLADAVHISRASAHARFKRLVDAQIIFEDTQVMSGSIPRKA